MENYLKILKERVQKFNEKLIAENEEKKQLEKSLKNARHILYNSLRSNMLQLKGLILRSKQYLTIDDSFPELFRLYLNAELVPSKTTLFSLYVTAEKELAIELQNNIKNVTNKFSTAEEVMEEIILYLTELVQPT